MAAAATGILLRYNVPHFKQIYGAVIKINKEEGNMCEINRVSETISFRLVKTNTLQMTGIT